MIYQRGMSLVQLMLSMTLGIIVVVMGIAVYQKMSRHYDKTVTVLEHHTQVLAVNELLTRLVDQAGIHSPFGQQAWQQHFFVGGNSPKLFGLDYLDYPHVYAQQYALLSGTTLTLADPDSDILMLQMVGDSTYLNCNTINGHQVCPLQQGDEQFSTALDLRDGRYFLISDAYKIALAVRKKDNETHDVVLTAPLPMGFHSPALVASDYRVVILYIRDTGRLDQQGDPILGLYQRSLLGPSSSSMQELVAGVEQMHIEVYYQSHWQRVDSSIPIQAWARDIAGLRVKYRIDGQAYTSVIALKGVLQ